MNLTQFSFKYPFFVICFWTAIFIFGIYAFTKLKVQAYPNSHDIVVSLSTAYPGAPKEIVLEDVTKPLEEKLHHIPHLHSIISSSKNEVCLLMLSFKNTTSSQAQSAVLSAVSQLRRSLPKEVQEPEIKIIDQFTLPASRIAITSTLAPSDLYEFVERRILPYFTTLSEISNVEVLGKRQKQIFVHLDRDKLKEREISVSEVVGQLQKNGKNAYLENPSPILIDGEYDTAADLGSIIIHYFSNDKAIPLSTIAEIREGLSEPAEATYFNGAPCLILEIYQQPETSILEIARKISPAVKEINNLWLNPSENVQLHFLSNSTEFMNAYFIDFEKSFWLAIGIAILLIGLVFRDLRSILSSVISIPASICGTFIVLYFLGQSLNFFSLGALTICIGLVIDDMIVIRENIFRYIEEGSHPFVAARKAMKEISMPVIGTSLAVIAAAVALIVASIGTSSYWGNFSFSCTMIGAMAFSLLEALTLGPILCAYGLSLKKQKEGLFFKTLSNMYQKILEPIIRHPLLINCIAAVIFLASCLCYYFTPQYNMPANVTGNLKLTTKFPLSLTKEETKKRALQFSNDLLEQYPQTVENIGLTVKKENQADFFIELLDWKKRKIPGYEFQALLEKKSLLLKSEEQIQDFFIEKLYSETPDHERDYDLFILGKDPNLLKKYSHSLGEKLRNFKGLTNLFNSFDIQGPKMIFVLDFLNMLRLGILTQPVFQELNFLLNGYQAKFFHPLSKKIKSEISIETSLKSANAYELLQKSYVPNINFSLIELKKFVKDVHEENSMSEILRKDGQPCAEITGDLTSYPANSISYTEKLIKMDFPLPKWFSISWGPKSLKLKEVTQNFLLVLLIAPFMIYGILVMLSKSVILPLLILLPLPFSMSGSFFILYFAGSSIDLMSTAGIILSIGIAAKNSIILVDCIQKLAASGLPVVEAIKQGCTIRLRPILLTSISIFLITLTMFIPWDEYAELEISLALAVIGGLLCSTFFSLVIVPVLYPYAHAFHEKFCRFSFRLLNKPE